MAEPLDRDTLFKKLRSKPENKVGGLEFEAFPAMSTVSLPRRRRLQVKS